MGLTNTKQYSDQSTKSGKIKNGITSNNVLDTAIFNNDFKYCNFNINYLISNLYNVHNYYEMKNEDNNNTVIKPVINVIKQTYKNNISNNLYIYSSGDFYTQANIKNSYKKGNLISLDKTKFKILRIFNLSYIEELNKNDLNILIIECNQITIISIILNNINKTIDHNLVFKYINKYSSKGNNIIFFNTEPILSESLSSQYNIFSKKILMSNLIDKTFFLGNNNIESKSNIMPLNIKYYNQYTETINTHTFCTPSNKQIINHFYTIEYSDSVTISEFQEYGTDIFHSNNIFCVGYNNIFNALKIEYMKYTPVKKLVNVYIVSGIFEDPNYPVDVIFRYFDKYDYLILFSDVSLNTVTLRSYKYCNTYIYSNKTLFAEGTDSTFFNILIN